MPIILNQPEVDPSVPQRIDLRLVCRRVLAIAGVLLAVALLMLGIVACSSGVASTTSSTIIMLTKPPASQITNTPAFDSLYSRAAFECRNAITAACFENVMLTSHDPGVLRYYRPMAVKLYVEADHLGR